MTERLVKEGFAALTGDGDVYFAGGRAPGVRAH